MVTQAQMEMTVDVMAAQSGLLGAGIDKQRLMKRGEEFLNDQFRRTYYYAVLWRCLSR